MEEETNMWLCCRHSGVRALSHEAMYRQLVPGNHKEEKGIHILKTLDTIGNCQSLALTVGVFQQLHIIANL